jgi:hypothetical protein
MRAGSVGASIVLIAVGAVMAYAVTATTEGFNINTAGVILMVVGAIGLVVSLLMMLIATDRTATTGDTHTETRVVERDRVV